MQQDHGGALAAHDVVDLNVVESADMMRERVVEIRRHARIPVRGSTEE
jgi:hypothetical protein